MGFWKKFAKWAIPIGAAAATVFTGGAAAPLLGMALGAGSGLASAKLGGASWKNALISAGIGGALGGVGGGALKGIGGIGSKAASAGAGQAAASGATAAGTEVAKQSALKGIGSAAAKYGPSVVQAAQAAQGEPPPIPSGFGGDRPPMQMIQRPALNFGSYNPEITRRTGLAGMGIRQYA